MLAFLSGAALMVFAPGNQVRMNGIDGKSFITAAIAVSYHSLQTAWNIFKTPLIWISAFAIFIYSQQTKHKWKTNVYINKLAGKKWLFPIAICIFIICSVLLPVVALKGGIIPDRYINTIICFIVPLLLSSVFIAGISGNSNALFTNLLQ